MAASVRGAGAVATTLEPAAASVEPALSGTGTARAACCTTECSGRAATTGVGAPVVAAGALVIEAVGEGAVGAEAAGEVETTTVLDLTSVVVQAPDVVALDDGAGAAGAVAELPALEVTFEPDGAAGDGGGDACLTAVSVVSRGAVMVVSRRTVAAFDALRTLSVGRAGEADRAVARRTCSIIAE